MPSNHTANYQLSQWVKQDKVLMEDFNADNAKIDAALKAGADARAAMAATLSTRGNCRVVYGSYTGSGLSGEAHPTTLTFDRPPVAVFIFPSANTGGYLGIPILRGTSSFYSSPTDPYSGCVVNWSGNSVSWYSYDGRTGYQLAQRDTTYVYAAFLPADE